MEYSVTASQSSTQVPVKVAQVEAENVYTPPTLSLEAFRIRANCLRSRAARVERSDRRRGVRLQS